MGAMKKSVYWIFSVCCYSALSAANFAVTNVNDSGAGSLREALLSLGAAGGVVTFDPGLTGQTITLSSPLPRLASDVFINPAATGPFVTIDGAGSNSIFFAQSGHIQLGNECYLTKRYYSANFVNQTPSFHVRTWSHPMYFISPGAELSFLWRFGLSAALAYSAELNARTSIQKLDGRVEWFF
jgi:hypothetical protein